MNPATGKAAFRSWQYNPQAKQMIETKQFLKAKYPYAPMEEALQVSYVFEMAIPKSWRTKNRKEALENKITHITKPDCSNLIKYYEDCMNEVLYVDDSQIVKTQACKVYSQEPKTRIWLRAIQKDEAKNLILEITGHEYIS